jgi:hypothetical protein
MGKSPFHYFNVAYLGKRASEKNKKAALPKESRLSGKL